jgi:integrase
MTGNSTRKRRHRKAGNRPPKPRRDFPLYPHPTGQWAKKIRGRLHYFGRWGHCVNGKLERIDGDGWEEAYKTYKLQEDDLHAGRTPRKGKAGELTLADLCNAFLTAKLRQKQAGEIGPRMFDEYKAITDLLIGQFGKTRLVDDLVADDFERLRATMAERWGPVRLVNAITRAKSVFKYGYESGLIDKPTRFGPQFKKPSASVLRRHRAANGKRMLDAKECRKLLEAATVQTKAMLLLGLNCGFGNHDCATLPLSAVDLENAIIEFPRPKSGVERRCPLWKETVEALRAVAAERPQPKSDEADGLVFVTSRGRPWLSGGIANPISHAVRNLMKAAGVHRAGIGPYTLRHVFRTIADGAKDTPATELIMGHRDPSMAAHYREHIDDSRLQTVVQHVHGWLFGEPATN